MDNIKDFKRHIAFDLDGTVLEETEWPELGKPIPENVAFIRALHKAGVPVAIYTARIYQDKNMEEKTAAYLEEIGVPYSELSCEKKPYYVLFVDDRAERVEHNKPWSEENKNNILTINVRDRARLMHMLKEKLVRRMHIVEQAQKIDGKDFIDPYMESLLINYAKVLTDIERYEMNKSPIEAMAVPRGIDLSKTYYHGTSKIQDAMKLMNEGIRPPDLTTKPKHKLTPVEGKVYITTDIEYATIYALGAAMIGEDMSGLDEVKTNRYGYLFVIDGSQLKDIQPDEDSIGELLHYQINVEDYGLEWLVDLARRVLTPLQFSKVTRYDDIGDLAVAGKKLLKHMNDEQKLRLLDRDDVHIAHSGVLYPKEVWRIDKLKSQELTPTASNFFEVAERMGSKVAAGRMKLSTFISKGQYQYVYFATGGQLMSLSNGQLTQPIIDEIVKKQPSIIWLIKNKMKKVSEFMSYWEQKQMEPKITYFGHPSNSMRRVVVFLKDGVLGEFFVISVYNKEQYIVKLSDLVKVNPNKFIIASLDEELDEKLNKDLTDEDIARILDKIKKKNLNINVLKLAWPEINTQKSDLLKKLREGKSNIV